jgi:hypothetical protein
LRPVSVGEARSWSHGLVVDAVALGERHIVGSAQVRDVLTAATVHTDHLAHGDDPHAALHHHAAA